MPELWLFLSQPHPTRLHITSAYNPQSNGVVEIFHGHLKSAMMARLDGPISLELPWVLPGIIFMCSKKIWLFFSRAGIRSATDGSGRFRHSWAGYPEGNTVYSATLRDSARPGTENFYPTWQQIVVCAVHSGTQRLRLCAPR